VIPLYSTLSKSAWKKIFSNYYTFFKSKSARKKNYAKNYDRCGYSILLVMSSQPSNCGYIEVSFDVMPNLASFVKRPCVSLHLVNGVASKASHIRGQPTTSAHRLTALERVLQRAGALERVLERAAAEASCSERGFSWIRRAVDPPGRSFYNHNGQLRRSACRRRAQGERRRDAAVTGRLEASWVAADQSEPVK